MFSLVGRPGLARGPGSARHPSVGRTAPPFVRYDLCEESLALDGRDHRHSRGPHRRPVIRPGFGPASSASSASAPAVPAAAPASTPSSLSYSQIRTELVTASRALTDAQEVVTAARSDSTAATIAVAEANKDVASAEETLAQALRVLISHRPVQPPRNSSWMTGRGRCTSAVATHRVCRMSC